MHPVQEVMSIQSVGYTYFLLDIYKTRAYGCVFEDNVDDNSVTDKRRWTSRFSTLFIHFTMVAAERFFVVMWYTKLFARVLKDFLWYCLFAKREPHTCRSNRYGNFRPGTFMYVFVSTKYPLKSRAMRPSGINGGLY